ncbi:hypothetical protein UMM65_11810 [Aureibaculum sp. 2210JD6-5]|uniref:hypothetical protein n=1 Tax=Aureibaculum sp. 2210JD6-5 TaxID=3103957 RepID=UPI002AAE3DC7|nr:hypothetical protein [Aureibaculum sp. 2210JD6-5]MDY7395933.1 hypothetical protein [Aureibaculum sp. 2210JD6-5]
MQVTKFFLGIVIGILMLSCSSSKKVSSIIEQQFYAFDKNSHFNSLESLLNNISQLPVRQREDSLIYYMSNGWMPDYNFRFKKVSYQHKNTLGKNYKISFWATPDYLSIGTNKDFVRMPLTPQSAQLLADQFHCVLPTTKMVDEIYKTANQKLPPIPLTENRDSLLTFVKHHLLIQEQLQHKIPNRIVAGIKKDVVQSTAVLKNPKPNRVAIYGWHKLDGKPIQPLYTGHVDWYVDYSHGIRLIYEKMLINNKVYFVKDVLNNPKLAGIICDDDECAIMRYRKGKID